MIQGFGHRLRNLSVPKHMQAYHGEATVNQQGQVVLSLPFPKGQRVEVVARPVPNDVNDKAEDKAWERIALDSFIEGYAEEDSIYDHYYEWRKNSGTDRSVVARM